LIGPNGAGKSTFIKILMDKLLPDSGEVVRNYQLKVGYYSQEFETFDFKQTLLDAFMHETRKDQAFSRAFLGRFNFIGDKVFQKIESLSGGEKTRLSIAILVGVDNNLLILDEPTTYLDVLSQRIILESLKQYEGTMIIVSHESEFLKELKPDKAYLFPEEKMVFWDDELLQKAEEI
jgi:ATPase subunit of ABC transporter with duplicated ATPase domains